MSRHLINLITGIRLWFKQLTLAIVADQQYTLTQTFYDGPMLIAVHLELHNFYMSGSRQLERATRVWDSRAAK
jgi:hypothetical protein